MNDQKSILIIGAGPTGLTLATEMHRLGLEPTIIDQRPGPSILSRAVGILPRSMELLESCLVAPQIRQRAITLDAGRIFRNDKEIIRLNFAQLADKNARLFCLPQDETETLLEDSLRNWGGQVHYSHELESIHATQDKVEVVVNGEPAVYDYVVGCDGIKSKVRQSQGIEYQGFDLDEPWSIADCTVRDWPGMAEMRLFTTSGQGVVVVLPIAKDRVRLVSNTANAMEVLPIPMHVTKTNRAGTFRISVRQAQSYQKGRVFLAGDAAHCHSPVGGRGMNLGIADAVDLAHRFAKGGLDAYSTHRHAQGAAGMALSERGRKLVTQGDTLKRKVALRAIGLLTSLGPMNRLAANALLGERASGSEVSVRAS